MRNPGADIEDVYVHRGLDEVVTAIGGHYRFTREVRLPFGGQELLYRCGYAVFDTTCCGRGGAAMWWYRGLSGVGNTEWMSRAFPYPGWNRFAIRTFRRRSGPSL
jgi:hypothetical protein